MNAHRKTSDTAPNKKWKLRGASILIIFLTLPTVSHAKIYKCVSAQGKTHFQDSPCVGGDSKEVTLKKMNTLDKSERVERQKQAAKTASSDRAGNKSSDRKKASPLEKQNQMMCEQAKKAYDREVASIKARCKKGRETFCSKSAEEIQKTWDSNYLRKEQGDAFRSPSKQWHAFHRNGGAPIFNLKSQVDQYCN